jgi:DNA/RNA-binding domain of Phe-tRNA-synthetase-like protein
MPFAYDPAVARTFPQLATGLIKATGLTEALDMADAASRFEALAKDRLGAGTEADLPAIRAWRAAFSEMGLKPTKYRCASEALLRRLRKEGSLPRVVPLVVLCNAVSAAYAVPVAAFDLGRVAGGLTVGPASGSETYLTFAGGEEHPEPGEIVFADADGTAHARRWTNRQGATSAVAPGTRAALIVIEGLHEAAEADVTAARDALADTLSARGATVRSGRLTGGAGRFDAAFGAAS